MASHMWITRLFADAVATVGSRRRGQSASNRNTRLRLETLEDRWVPATTLTVTTAADSGVNSFRWALAVANQTPDVVTINFSIGAQGSQHTINVRSPLPVITNTVVINGASQGGTGYAGTPLINLNGAQAGRSTSGLTLSAKNSVIQGLAITSFAQDGILVRGNATGNIIGGTVAGSGNVIAGNGNHGIEMVGAGVVNNQVLGNLIGLKSNGTVANPNGFNGVLIRNGASNNTIGGTATGAGNIISGNKNQGIEIVGPLSNNNEILGNTIGLNQAGTAAIGNWYDGILIRNAASNNSVGGTMAGAGNTISGNGNDGIELVGPSTTGNVIQGNIIGLNRAGTAAVRNRFDGITIRNAASSNSVGGTTAAARNTISGNGNDGIEIIGSGSNSNSIQGNYIGSDVTGTLGIANAANGILVRYVAKNNAIGGTTAGAGNLISGNGQHGIVVTDKGTTGTQIQGNLIGLQSDGTTALGNGGNGVRVTNVASNTFIGGTAIGAGNTIAFNRFNGVQIGSPPSGTPAGLGNRVLGNSIYSNQRLGIFLGPDNTSKPPVVLTNNSKGHPNFNNRYQNFPVLQTPVVSGSSTILSGTLSSPSTPNQVMRIELFSNTVGDPTGYGQGQTYLGSVTVTTNGRGQATFTLTLGSPLASGLIVTATATDAQGNTSEFSKGVTVP